jgi:hypothetical protein
VDCMGALIGDSSVKALIAQQEVRVTSHIPTHPVTTQLLVNTPPHKAVTSHNSGVRAATVARQSVGKDDQQYTLFTAWSVRGFCKGVQCIRQFS